MEKLLLNESHQVNTIQKYHSVRMLMERFDEKGSRKSKTRKMHLTFNTYMPCGYNFVNILIKKVIECPFRGPWTLIKALELEMISKQM